MMQRQEMGFAGLDFFSDDVLFEILGHLPPVEAVGMAFVSKRFANFIGNDFAWKHKFQCHYPEKFKILSEWQERVSACYKALTEADKVLFPEVAQELSDQLNIPNYWYTQFVNEDKQGSNGRRVKKIFYALKEDDTQIFNQITFDMIEASNKNGESILDLTRQKGHQAVLDKWYKIAIARGVGFKKRTLLHWAVMLNQFALIPAILRANPDLLNQKDDFWNTPLMLAAGQNQEDIVSLLLQQKKVNISVKNKNKQPALYLATMTGNVVIVDKLLSAYPSGFVGLDNLLKNNLMLAAAQLGHLALLERFVKSDPSLLPDVKSNENMTLLMTAAWRGRVEIVNFLLKENTIPLNVMSQGFNDTTKNNLTALDFAALSGNVTIVEAIAAAMNEIIALESLKKLLLIAAREKHLALVKWIVEYGHCNYPENKLELLHAQDASSKTPLLFAMHNKDIAMVFFLLKNDAMSKLDRSAQEELLLEAAREGYLSLVKQLIEADPSLFDYKNNQAETVLQLAMHRQHKEIVKWLVDKVVIEKLDRLTQKKLLLTAAERGYLSVVRQLIEADPILLNEEDEYGHVPLRSACFYNHLSVVQFLLTQPGIGINDGVKHPFFPENAFSLISAVRNGNIEMAEALLNAGADMNPNTDDNQPIHWAASNLHVGMMELLLKKDPSLVNQINIDGLTPLMLAVFDLGYHQIALPAVEFLLKQPGINVWATNAEEVDEDQHGWAALHYAADRENYAYHDSDHVVKAILKHMLTDMLKPDFSKSLITPVNCEKLTKKTSFAIQLLQLALEEKKREVLTPYSPGVFGSNERRVVVDSKIKDIIRAVALLINLIIYDQNPKDYESDLARFQRVLENNAELKTIYDGLCEVDSRFELTSHELTLK